jgi:DNA-binding response OmpR family regulator
MATILVIDDETDVRDAIELILTEAGHSVQGAADGATGLEACRRTPPDLVLTDLVMPNAHGFDVIGRLRAEAPTVRIVAISGGGNFAPQVYHPESVTTNAYLAAALEMGADAILKKPFNKRELIDAVDRCLAAVHRRPAP